MTSPKSLAQTLRNRAANLARRASMARDPVVEDGHRRLARHCLVRATALERSAGASREDPPAGDA